MVGARQAALAERHPAALPGEAHLDRGVGDEPRGAEAAGPAGSDVGHAARLPRRDERPPAAGELGVGERHPLGRRGGHGGVGGGEHHPDGEDPGPPLRSWRSNACMR